MSINMNDLSLAFTDLAKQTADFVGLKEFKVEVQQSMGFPLDDYGFYLVFSKKVNVDRTAMLKGDVKTVFSTAFDPIFENVKNSDCVESQLKDLRDANSSLRSSLQQSEARIKELEKYEEYYNLTFKMNHGAK